MYTPLVSVITPVLNSEEKIAPFIEAVLHQSYPRDRYEIVIVDNGSTDKTTERVLSFPDVTLLERKDIQNPYAARNEGIRNSHGEIIALLDVNCMPVQNWLEQGVERLQCDGADLVGGHISYAYSKEETLGEWYDSLLFVDMEDLIRRGQSCAGGNLFFRREVVEEIGLFPESHRSGMDLYWTKKATKAGLSLIYDRDAEAVYSARKLRPLLQKVFRVGTGQPKVWLDNDMSPVKMALLILYQFIPPGMSELKEKINRRGKQEMYKHVTGLWLIHYLQKITLSLGWTKGLLNYYRTDK